jgi:hypothetical protein
LDGVCAGVLLRERPDSLQEGEEIAARNVFHDEIDIVSLDERIVWG